MSNPPGWYPIQDSATPLERYWNGDAWTDHVRAAAGTTPQPILLPPKPPVAKRTPIPPRPPMSAGTLPTQPRIVHDQPLPISQQQVIAPIPTEPVLVPSGQPLPTGDNQAPGKPKSKRIDAYVSSIEAPRAISHNPEPVKEDPKDKKKKGSFRNKEVMPGGWHTVTEHSRTSRIATWAGITFLAIITLAGLFLYTSGTLFGSNTDTPAPTPSSSTAPATPSAPASTDPNYDFSTDDETVDDGTLTVDPATADQFQEVAPAPDPNAPANPQ